MLRDRVLAIALATLGACASPSPAKLLDAAASSAASTQMLVDAWLHGYVPHDYTQRLLQANRQDAHSLGAEVPYGEIDEAHRAAAVAALSRLGIVLDELASDETLGNQLALAKDARELNRLRGALDSLAHALPQQ
jgi:hypothetical protein